MNQTASPRPAANSRMVLLMAGLAGPLNATALAAVALALLVMGLAKFHGGAIDTPMVGVDGAGGQLLGLATGGVIAAPWGHYLIGSLQVLLCIGLLVPPARAMAGFGCLLAAAAVVVGGIVHRDAILTGTGLNPAGVALVVLTIVLLCAAALAARAAAKRTGAAS